MANKANEKAGFIVNLKQLALTAAKRYVSLKLGSKTNNARKLVLNKIYIVLTKESI